MDLVVICKHGAGVLHYRLAASKVARGAPKGATSTESIGQQ